ncbi:MAG: hypothetical protein GDA68_22250 [Nitrospira sp. CR2.1]|nr:hypothetical protein [Nitrospira sp. CR2.1]
MKPGVAVEALELAKEDGGGRRLADGRERKRLLAAFDASGLTQRVFARQEGINYFTFAGWLRQRRLKSGQLGVTLRAKTPAFVEVNLPKTAYAVEVVMPGGLIVRAGRTEDAVACVKGLR